MLPTGSVPRSDPGEFSDAGGSYLRLASGRVIPLIAEGDPAPTAEHYARAAAWSGAPAGEPEIRRTEGLP